MKNTEADASVLEVWEKCVKYNMSLSLRYSFDFKVSVLKSQCKVYIFISFRSIVVNNRSFDFYHKVTTNLPVKKTKCYFQIEIFGGKSIDEKRRNMKSCARIVINLSAVFWFYEN